MGLSGVVVQGCYKPLSCTLDMLSHLSRHMGQQKSSPPDFLVKTLFCQISEKLDQDIKSASIRVNA
jgi:hypothetical protein